MAGPESTNLEEPLVVQRGTARAPTGAGNTVIWLDDAETQNREIAGGKASALARARGLGLPVLDGFVITTDTTSRLQKQGAASFSSLVAGLESSWKKISKNGIIPLAVRSSSVAEDDKSSSMAGMFTSVIGVSDWDEFSAAVSKVIASARMPGAATAPIAVLVQPVLDARSSGVMFGIDPVTGRADRLVVAAVDGGPQALVSGEVDGSRFVLSHQGRVIEAEVSPGGAMLGGKRRRALAHLAAEAERAFGEAQDMEWAFDESENLWLFQSRPVTATAVDVDASGPVMGPGPVAETFPLALTRLEEELWLEPMRAGLVESLGLLRTASRKRLRTSPVVVSIGGRVAADLELLGVPTGKKSFLRKLDPRPPFRRLLASWDAGRLRSAMPLLARNAMQTIDEELEAISAVTEMDSEELLETMRRARRALVGLHGHEVLAGMLLPKGAAGASGSTSALRALSDGRKSGLSDSQIIARSPGVLALVAPSVAHRPRLPEPPAVLPTASTEEHPLISAREDLRIRARWVQELAAVAARELGSRLTARGLLECSADVAHLSLDELAALVRNNGGERRFVRPVASEVTARRGEVSSSPLPSTFRLGPKGEIVPLNSDAVATGAGGGRAKGRVALDPASAGAGDVLVVQTLDPELAATLPGLAGLVSETGSVLSHLAILAREFGVPIVVGLKDATKNWAEGTEIVLDGSTGEVEPVQETVVL